MTRQQLDHERYMSNCEERRARMRAYYQENKEFIKEKRKEFVERRRKDLAMKVIETKVTIKELEERLPPPPTHQHPPAATEVPEDTYHSAATLR